MQDSFRLPSNDNDNWLMYPGAKIDSYCQLTDSALHFAGTATEICFSPSYRVVQKSQPLP